MLCLQPYARARSALWSDGYFARFAFVVAPLTEYGNARYPKGRLTYPKELVTALRQWHERLGVPEVSVLPVLDQKSKPTGRYRLAGGELRETTYTLSDPVWEAYYQYDAAMRRLIGQAETQDLDGSYARFPMKALRIAGLLASVEGGPSRRIERHHWYRGRQIAERWRASLHRLVSQLEADVGDSRAAKVEAHVLRTLRKHGALSPREINQRSGIALGEVLTTLDALQIAQVVERVPTAHTTKYRYRYESGNGHALHQP
ncbi:MAG: hypothetical protein M3361_11890 [Candidatus Tectomicrobia bacterium]|nr:hypothetical protein [Candidatus Tectomicrobia bacterium]